MGPALLAVLLLGRVVGRELDLLRVSGEVVPHAVRQIAQAVVGHDTSLSRIARPLFTRRYNASFPRRGGHTKHRLRARPATTRPETRCLTKMIPAGETLDHLSPTLEDHP